MPYKFSLRTLALAALLIAFTAKDRAQSAASRALITQAVDENKLVTLVGNTRPEAISKNDLGPVASALHLDMYLQLKRSPERELAAKQFVESLTDKTSPSFHKWITAAEYGQRFGADPEDIATVSRWLQAHGFTVNGTPASNMVIDFSGNAGQVREALHTEIHNLDVAGKRYFANMSDPRIPSALLPAVTGVVSLSNIKPHPMLVPKAQYTVNSANVPIVPGDLATIYNLNPVFAAGYTGKGQTVVVVEDTDVFSGSSDWNTFRKTFGLDRYSSGSLTQVHPTSGKGSPCVDPGINGDDVEAALDVEWASAAAPDAAIVMASCEGATNFGGFIALQNMLTNGGPLPSVVSISYGASETEIGAAENTYINTLYQTAAAAGVSVFVSTGDSNAAGNDRGESIAIHGINVSGFASTIYNVAVGGTDFGDYASGLTANFWNSSNTPYYDSARSYVPEIPWNDSCGSLVLANYYGFTANDTASGICNSLYNWLDTDGGSGGPSACATGVPAIAGVVSGSCAGYAKPSWQSIFGNPSDGVRDLPDVSLFAAPGIWGHYYVFCFSAGASCSGPPSTWAGAGGTSFSSPIMAGIQALINQAAGETNVGNPNPVYYGVAQSQYNSSQGRVACNSSTGPASTCSFNDVTQGDIVVPCAGTFNCYLGGAGLGVLSTSDTSDQPAFAAAPGWDFATGVGTVNVFNLLNAFVGAVASPAAPPAPALVTPANGTTGVLPTTLLAWNASPGATSYDVYFGTASSPPLVTNTLDINYSPGALTAGTTYYWAIGARNSAGANASMPSSFTTSCAAALSPSSATAPAAGGSGTVPVAGATGCAWTAASTATWITISSGNSGSGSGTVAYTISPDTGAQRSGTITIAGQTFTVTQAGIYPLISTLTGGSMPPTPALGTSLSIPVAFGIAVDSSGDIYFSSPNMNAVFKVDSSGVVTRIAGNGVPGRSGDGGPALRAELNSPNGVAIDSAGNVYIADTNNRIVRKVDNSGNISTAAGDGNCCTPSGDGGPAAGAAIGTPYSLAMDSSGNLFIGDVTNNIVREVAASGTITTVAGTGASGYSGDGAAATGAKLNGPYGLAIDTSGNLYIADRYNYRIRMVSSGTITTVAGNGKCCYSGDGGAATNAMLYDPSGVAVDSSGNIYIADTYNERIRVVSTSGTITTVAGDGVYGFSGDGAAAAGAKLVYPEGIALDTSGNLYIADSGNARIREVNTSGSIATLVGGAMNDGGLGVFGLLNLPSGVIRDQAGNTYIADTNNNRVRKVTAAGMIMTVAGTGVSGFSGDGAAANSATLNVPQGLALDSSNNLYIADTNNHRIRKVDGSGNITTVAGNGNCCSSTGDGGAAINAGIGTPYGLAVDSSANLYITDISNNVVREVSSGNIMTVAGNGSFGYSGDGGPATAAKLYDPFGVAVDSAGNLYIADYENLRIRMVSSTTGTISTVAGNGSCCYSGDGGQATKALLSYPRGVALDAAGDLYIADSTGRVRRVDVTGTISTVAGNGSSGYSGDGGLATGATFRSPYGISVDAAGNVAVSDQSNNVVRLLTPLETQPVLSIQSAHNGTFTQGQNGASYAVTVSNASGAAPTNGAVTVAGILPTGLTLVTMAGAGWTCSSTACTRSDALSGGSSYPPITVTVNVSAAAPGQLTFQATVSGGGGNIAGTADLNMITPPHASSSEVARRQ